MDFRLIGRIGVASDTVRNKQILTVGGLFLRIDAFPNFGGGILRPATSYR